MPYVKASRLIKANRLLVWKLVSNFDHYKTIHPEIKRVTYTNISTDKMILEITDLANRQWKEEIIDWEEKHQYTLAVDVKYYPYPLNRHLTTVELNDDEQGSMLTVRIDYSVKYGSFGKLLDKISIKHALSKLTGKMLDNMERLVSAETLQNL